jgi:hypothetical protein
LPSLGISNQEQPKTIVVNGRKLVVIGSSSDEEDDDLARKPGSSLRKELWAS